MLEDIGVEPLQKMFNIDLSGFNFAPFYGCYLIRPSDALGMTRTKKKTFPDIVIESTGAKSTDYEGKTRCCGFPFLINQKIRSKWLQSIQVMQKTMVQMQW